MITKHIRRAKPGNVKALIAYMLKGMPDEPDEEQLALLEDEDQLWYTRATNMGLEKDYDPVLAAAIMAATQAQNTRAKKDLTYHLVVSFREGEHPTAEQLEDVEQTLADAIGLGEHHRVSALHTDTANWHLHIAISRVHPETTLVVERYRDYDHLDKARAGLEERHGFEIDNRIDRSSGDVGQGKKKAVVADIEAHTGIQTFYSWLQAPEQSDRLAEIRKTAKTWPDVHGALAGFGLSLRPRGAGLVVTDGSVFGKASEIGAGWSKKQLESDFGPFEAPVAHAELVDQVEGHPEAVVDAARLDEIRQDAKTWEDVHAGLEGMGLSLLPHGNDLMVSDGEVFDDAGIMGGAWAKSQLVADFGAFESPAPDDTGLGGQVKGRPHASTDAMHLTEIRQAAKTWDDVHAWLEDMGLSLKPTDAGLMVSDGAVFDDTGVMGSEWTKDRLEADLGPYAAAGDEASTYRALPLAGAESPLWQEYQKEREAGKGTSGLRRQRKQAIYQAYRELSDDLFRSPYLDYDQRQRRMSEMGLNRAQKLQEVDEQIPGARPRTWVEFLADHAIQGNMEALSLLRERKRKADEKSQGTPGLYVTVVSQTQAVAYTPEFGTPFKVTKSGAVMYRPNGRGGPGFIDHGDKVTVSGNMRIGVANGIEYAARKWAGQSLIVEGSDEWRHHVVHCAVAYGVDVTFNDPLLQRLKGILVEQSRHWHTAGAAKTVREINAQAAAQKIDEWIQQRNATGQRVADYVPIELFDRKRFDGVYSGTRDCGDGHYVALVQKDDVMMAIPISEYQRRRWRQQSQGDDVHVNGKGQLVTSIRSERSK